MIRFRTPEGRDGNASPSSISVSLGRLIKYYRLPSIYQAGILYDGFQMVLPKGLNLLRRRRVDNNTRFSACPVNLGNGFIEVAGLKYLVGCWIDYRFPFHLHIKYLAALAGPVSVLKWLGNEPADTYESGRFFISHPDEDETVVLVCFFVLDDAPVKAIRSTVPFICLGKYIFPFGKWEVVDKAADFVTGSIILMAAPLASSGLKKSDVGRRNISKSE